MGKLDYKISEKTRHVLMQGDFNERLALLKEKYPDADPRVFNNLQRALMHDNLMIALFEDMITLEEASKLVGARLHYLALTDNGLQGFHEKLFTVDAFYKARSEYFLVNCVSDNGLKVLRESIITMAQLKALPSDDHFTYLVSDDGIQALLSKKMTVEQAAQYQDPLALKQALSDLAKAEDDDELKLTPLSSYWMENEGDDELKISPQTQAILQLPQRDWFEAVKMIFLNRAVDPVTVMMISEAMSEYLVFVLSEKLLTVAELYNVLSSIHLRETLFCRNGMKGLQDKLFTYQDLLGLRNEDTVNELLSNETFYELFYGRVTFEEIKLRGAPKAAAVVPAQPTKARQVDKPVIEDPTGKIKFNRMLRYIELNCTRNDEAKDNDFEVLSFFLKNLTLQMFGDPQCLLDVLVKVRNSLDKNSRFLAAIDKTFAQWVQGGLIAREAIEATNIYTPADLTHLLSGVYPVLEIHQGASSTQAISNPAQERLAVVARLLADQYPSFEEQRVDLLKLFELRKYYQSDPSLFDRASQLKNEVNDFFFGIAGRDQWSDEKTVHAARQLLIRSLLVSDEILASLLQHLIENQCVESTNDPVSSYFAIRFLINQSRPFCRAFLNSGIIDFYASIRVEMIFAPSSTRKDKNGNPIMERQYLYPEDAHDARFYKAEPERSAWRKMYNTFVKYGFVDYFSLTKDGGRTFRAMLKCEDERFDIWTKPDQIKTSQGSHEKFTLFADKDRTQALTYAFPARWARRPT